MKDTEVALYWFLIALIPWFYVAVAAVFSRGLRGQDSVVRAGSPERFSRAVTKAGGPASLMSGLWLDAVFVVSFVAVTAPLLAQTIGWWAILPVAAAGLDLAETLTLAPMLKRRPTEARTRILAALAKCKLMAYFASVVALFLAWLSVMN
jgi:hypothetical protein